MLGSPPHTLLSPLPSFTLRTTPCPPPQAQAGTVGPPQPVLSFRLEAVPTMNYDPLANPPR